MKEKLKSQLWESRQWQPLKVTVRVSKSLFSISVSPHSRFDSGTKSKTDLCQSLPLFFRNMGLLDSLL